MREIQDFGHPYSETNLESFPVELWSTVTNLGFLLLMIYWWRKMGLLSFGPFRSDLRLALPVLFIGFVGGTIFHATRSHSLWLILDFAPIYLIALYFGFRHWLYWTNSYLRSFLILTSIAILGRILIQTFVPSNSPHYVSWGYVGLAVSLAIPVFRDAFHNGKGRNGWLWLTVGSFALALGFRAIDTNEWIVELLPQGTHWLWHIFGCLACHFFLKFMSLRPFDSDLSSEKDL